MAGVALAAALGVSLAGCPRPSEQAADGGAGAAPHADGLKGPGPGLRVSLPTGWQATAAGEDALVIGPQGRAVMRISRSRLAQVPDLKKLQAMFSSDLSEIYVETLDAREEEGRVLWRGRLTARSEGARTWTVALGAKQVGRAVFLCSTEPGATESEVKAAADSCLRLGQ